MPTFREWFLKNHDRPDVKSERLKRLSEKKEELARKRQEAKEKAPRPATRRSLLKNREQIFIHPITGEKMWSRTFAIKKMGITLQTFLQYRKSGWIPKAFIVPDIGINGWEVFTSRQIMLVRQLANKRIKRHRNVPEFIMYMEETWNDVETNLAKKPEKHIKGRNKTAARDKRTGISREQKRRQTKE